MSNTSAQRPVRLKSPFTRAVVPVVGGVAFLLVVALITWGIAAWISGGGADVTDRLAPSRFEVGSVENVSRIVEETGPILFPGLNTTTGERTLVLDHEGDDPARGWKIFYAFPVDRPDCAVEQIKTTRQFIDCDGTTIEVEALSPPEAGVNPVVEDQRLLVIDLSGVTTD